MEAIGRREGARHEGGGKVPGGGVPGRGKEGKCRWREEGKYQVGEGRKEARQRGEGGGVSERR